MVNSQEDQNISILHSHHHSCRWQGLSVIKPISSIQLCSHFFLNYPEQWLSTGYHIHIWQLLLTLVKYECDLKNLTYIFARLKISTLDIQMNAALVNTTPGHTRIQAISRNGIDMEGLALTQLSIFFQNVIYCSNVILYKYNPSAWNWSSTPNIKSVLWILMTWCFSTRASVATVLSMHMCVSSCLWVKPNYAHMCFQLFID